MKRIVQSVKSKFDTPAPRWFRITKVILSNTMDFIIGVLLLMGKSDDTILLIIKLSQSFIMQQLEVFLSNGEVYADISKIKASQLQEVKEVKLVDSE